MLRVAAASMMRAIRAGTVERGRDPRSFTLLAFGGNGPLFAAAMAAKLGIARILVPTLPGLFSAFGLLVADTEHHLTQSFRTRLENADPGAVAGSLGALRARAAERLTTEGFPAARQIFSFSALARYAGQSTEIAVPRPEGGESILENLGEAFAVAHERTYGFRAPVNEPVELTGFALLARGVPDRPRLPERMAPAAPRPERRRDCWFPGLGWHTTPILERGALGLKPTPGPRAGPLVVQEYDATALVPPGAFAACDDFGNIRITLA
jgi:N-methylhydantoinase A